MGIFLRNSEYLQFQIIIFFYIKLAGLNNLTVQIIINVSV